MVAVKATHNEPIEVLIRKFNKKVADEGVLTEIKKKEFYLKPSAVRQQKIAASRKRYVRRRWR